MSLPASRARCLLADQLGVQRRSRAVAAATRMAGFAVVLLLQIQLRPAAIFCGSAGPKLFTSNISCAAAEPLRRAADALAGRLRAGGPDAELQPAQRGVRLGA